MNKRNAFHLMIILVLVTIVTACTRPLPGPKETPVVTTPTEGEMLLPTPTSGAEILLPTQPPVTPPTAVPTQPVVQPTLVPAQPEPVQPAPTQVEAVVAPEEEEEEAVESAVPETYRLKAGEYPYCIARRFNVDPVELMRINKLYPWQVFQAGLKLKIPQDGDNYPYKRNLRSHPARYTVQPGDTIYSIACYYGSLDPLKIARANDLRSPYRLTVGEVLKIP